MNNGTEEKVPRPNPDYYYQVGGSLAPTAPSYVKRQVDDQLYNWLIQREFCHVLTPRQMGKSSLRVRTMARLQTSGICCGVLDMTTLGFQDLSRLQWYASLIKSLIRIFNLPTHFRNWWAEHHELSPVQCLCEFLEEELLHNIQAPVVLFLDEIDSLLRLNFSIDDFFAFIRACYDRRAEQSQYRRLTFVLIGVAIPSDLISNVVTTPFNIGKMVAISGFKSTETAQLIHGLKNYIKDPDSVLQKILDWTGGQPFLVQKCCYLVQDQNAAILTDKIEHLPDVDLESVIQANIINNWEAQDQPEHFKTIRDRILHNPNIAGRVLGLYQQLLAGDNIATDGSLPQLTLRLSGLVVDQQGQLAIANPIYRAIFNQDWVAQHLSTLRPYAVSLQAWVASRHQDQTCLLSGLALQAALAWAEDKRLSDLDYRFLAASQEAATQGAQAALATESQKREQAEFALQAATEATALVTQTRQAVRSHLLSQRRVGRWLAVIAVGVTAAVGLGRWAGLMQDLELAMLDQFFRSRPAAKVDETIVVITIGEPDIQSIGQFPVPDQVLAQAINTINQAQPRLIGLDIYRDLPVPPGHQALVNVFTEIPHLYGIEKAVADSIAPPPALVGTDRVGFADQLFDGDGKVRRALLSIESEDGNLKFSFPLTLALAYLEAEGIQPQPLRHHPDHIKLGKQTLRPLAPNDGGYVRADTGGYQMLLNYMGAPPPFPTYSISEVLAGQVPPQMLRDRIVLIGSTASTLNDLLLSPYPRRSGYLSGVMVHAHTLSMLLRSALEGRPLLNTGSEPLDLLWILVWATVGAAIASQWWRPIWMSMIALGIALSLSVVSAFGLFLSGWWVPVLPASFAMVLAAIAVPLLTVRRFERAILTETTRRLVTIAQANPAVGQIAIAYFKQLERQEHQAWIEKAERDTE